MGAPAVSPPPMYEPNYQYVGTEQGTGKPVYHDIHTAQDVTGATPIGPKPSTAMSTFLLKQQAYLQSHPDDQNGALEFANGKRNMSPAQMQESALNQANKELADATLAGAVIPDPDAWVRQKTAANYALISGAGAPQVSNPKAVTAPAARMSAGERQQSLANAKAFIKAHPELRDKVIARVQEAGLPTQGL